MTVNDRTYLNPHAKQIQAHYFPTFSNKDVAFLHKDSKVSKRVW